MGTIINLNAPPYWDDYDPNKQFYKILFKPGTAVQARELTQIQDIAQNQIKQIGDFTFANGSIVSGCGITFDSALQYVKINDNWIGNNQYVSVNTLEGYTVTNSNGLSAYVTDTLAGYQSSYNANNAQFSGLNTLFVKYLNTSNNQQFFNSNDVLSVLNLSNTVIGQLAVANSSTYPVGMGYSVHCSNGTIYNNGYFIDVNSQDVVVTPYTNIPDGITVGFDINQSVVTPYIDSSLFDNSLGSSNYRAPGANRLKLTANLITVNTATQNTSFFSVVNFQQGFPVTVNTSPQLATLGKVLAQQVYDESGDFVLSPFNITVAAQPVSSVNANTYNNVIISPGVGYFQGYKTTINNNVYLPIAKGLNTTNILNDYISVTAGGQFYVQEYCGVFDPTVVQAVELHSTAKTALTSKTFLNTSYSNTDIIGTGYVKAVEYQSGIPGTPTGQFGLYLLDYKLNPGFTVNSIRSFICQTAGVITGVCDAVLASNNVVYDSNVNDRKLVYAIGQPAVANVSNSSFTYRNKVTSSLFTSNTLTVSVTGQIPFGGTLDGAEAESFEVIPTANLTVNAAGTISTFSNTTVTGANTNFLNAFITGDYITANNQVRQVVQTINSTSVIVDTAFTFTASGITYNKIYPAGLPINFVNTYSQGLGTNTRYINVNSNSATFYFTDTFTANGVGSTVFLDTVVTNAPPTQKVVNKQSVIAINIANNAGGLTGPWSLGLPDVFNIDHIYVDYTGAYGQVNDFANNFMLDTGQHDSYYGLSSIKISPNNPINITANTSLVVVCDNFTANISSGQGFYTVGSYPIDDVNLANTAAIPTAEIPVYVSVTDGTIYDLRDSIDFRPSAVATANVTTSISTATINPTNTISFTNTNHYIASINNNFISNFSYYLGRKDLVTINSTGQLNIVQGIYGLAPTAPSVPAGTSALGVVAVPPYPSLAMNQNNYGRYDYTCSTQSTQNRRYTMQDIAGLDTRISDIEYYTSLSQVELAANNLSIISATTGQNRFKNGILVDSFVDFSVCDTTDPTFYVSIDAQNHQMRPGFYVNPVELTFNSSLANGVTQQSDMVISSYVANTCISQNSASQVRSCVTSDIYQWHGNLTLTPSSDTIPDVTVSPTVTNYKDSASNLVNTPNTYGTIWGLTNVIGAPAISGTITTRVQRKEGDWVTVTKAWNYSNPSQLSTAQPAVQPTASLASSLGVQPYVRSQWVLLCATGLKPNTAVYLDINNVEMASTFSPLTSAQYNTLLASYTPLNEVGYDNTVSNLIKSLNTSPPGFATTDITGTCYGAVLITPSTFSAGLLRFSLTDVSNVITYAGNITTSAQQTFVAPNITTTTAASQLVIATATQTLAPAKAVTSPGLVEGSYPSGTTVWSNVVFSDNGGSGVYTLIVPSIGVVYSMPTGYAIIYRWGGGYAIPWNNSGNLKNTFKRNQYTGANFASFVANATLPVLLVEIIKGY